MTKRHSSPYFLRNLGAITGRSCIEPNGREIKAHWVARNVVKRWSVACEEEIHFYLISFCSAAWWSLKRMKPRKKIKNKLIAYQNRLQSARSLRVNACLCVNAIDFVRMNSSPQISIRVRGKMTSARGSLDESSNSVITKAVFNLILLPPNFYQNLPKLNFLKVRRRRLSGRRAETQLKPEIRSQTPSDCRLPLRASLTCWNKARKLLKIHEKARW